MVGIPFTFLTEGTDGTMQYSAVRHLNLLCDKLVFPNKFHKMIDLKLASLLGRSILCKAYVFFTAYQSCPPYSTDDNSVLGPNCNLQGSW